MGHLIFSLFKHNFYKKCCRHQRDSSLDLQSRRRACWQINQNHGRNVSYYTLMPSIIDSKSWINLYKKIIARIVAIRRGSFFSKYRKNIFFSRKRLVSVGHIQKPVESNLGNLEINFRNLTWNSFPSVLNKKLPRFNIKSIIL